MKLSTIERLCSKDIKDNVVDRLDINFKRSVNFNLQRANLLLAKTIAAPPKIFEFEPLLVENYQLEDIQANKQPVWFKILVIEDDDSSRDRLCKMLRSKDTQVIEAKESRAGIKLAKSLFPDLVICELMMPEIDGYGIKYFLQYSRITEKIPLLFITTHTKQSDRDSETILIVEKGKIKPVNKEKFLDAIAQRRRSLIANKLVSLTQV